MGDWKSKNPKYKGKKVWFLISVYKYSVLKRAFYIQNQMEQMYFHTL